MYNFQQPHSLSTSQRSLSPPPSPFIASSSPTDPDTYYSDTRALGSATGAVGESRGMEFGSQPTGTSGVGGVPFRKRSGISSVRDEERRKEVAKVDQIIQHFFAKTCAVISQSRMSHLEDLTSLLAPTPGGAGLGESFRGGASNRGRVPLRRVSTGGKRTNKWFNLELDETDLFRTELKTWRTVSNLLSSSSIASSPSSSTRPTAPVIPTAVPPMILDIILDTRSLTPNQVLVLSDQRGKRIRVESPPNSNRILPSSATASPGSKSPSKSTRPNVVLERWTLSLSPEPNQALSPTSPSYVPPITPPQTSQPSMSLELPSVYRQSIILFRSLFSLIRVLPSWGLYRRLARRRAGVGGSGLQIGCRMSVGQDEIEVVPEEIEVDVGIAEVAGEKVVETVTWPAVSTPFGYLHLECTYRLNAEFAVEDIETLLSSRFIDEDFFKPTVARYQQEPATARPGSLPTTGRSPLASTSSPPTTQHQSYGSLSSRHHLAVPFPSTSEQAPPSNEVSASLGSNPAESASSGGRYGSYGGGVEPAFVSLSRARAASYAGGIQRASALSSSPSSQPRRPSFTSSSSSPIFRAGSYISAPPSQSTGGPTNPHRLSIGARSPLAPPFPPNVASGIASAAPRPIPNPTPRSYSGSLPRSFGRGSSNGSGSGDAPGNWAGPESLGRRTGGRVSSGDSGSVKPWALSGSGGIRTTLFPGTLEEGIASGSGRGSKAFLLNNPDDASEINDFLGMIDSRPSLRKLGAGGSTILSKTQADETLKMLAGSVYSTSPSSLPGAIAEGDGSYSRLGALLNRRPSRLSISEETSTAMDPPPRPRLGRRSDILITGAPSISPTEPYFISRAKTSTNISSPNPSFPRFAPHPPPQVTTGFDLGPPTSFLLDATPVESSTISLGATDSGIGTSRNSYGGEQEAVGRMDLSGFEDESEANVVVTDQSSRGRLEYEKDRDEMGAGWREERDQTPGQPLHRRGQASSRDRT